MDALLITDVQKAMDDPKWGERNNPLAEDNMSKLLRVWRDKGWPVIHIQDCSPNPNSPYREGQPLHDFKDEVAPQDGELIIKKTTGNAFLETGLKEELRKRNIQNLVFTGVHTQYCIDTTVRMAASLGFNVSLVSDATVATAVKSDEGTYWSADEVHVMTLSILSNYSMITSTLSLIENN